MLEDYGVCLLEFLTLAWELEYEQGHFFKRGRVQALGKVPVGMQGDANAPCGGVGVSVSGLETREERRGDAVEPNRLFSLIGWKCAVPRGWSRGE